MLVYIEELDDWFNSANTAIMLHLSDRDKKQIAGMPHNHERYLSAPVGTSKIKMNNLLQKPPPLDDLSSGLDDLNIDGIASVGGDED